MKDNNQIDDSKLIRAKLDEAARLLKEKEKIIEAQKRELDIETSLERVRISAMAMHTSTDLSATAELVFTELKKLGIYSIRCGVVLLSETSRDALLYAATNSVENNSLSLIGSISMSGHPSFDQQYEHWQKKENYFTELTSNELEGYYEALNSCLTVRFPKHKYNQKEYGYYFAFSEGLFYIWTVKPYSENQINILNRFKNIIELTFRRYLDLKNAEAQAREAIIEVSLERVRTQAIVIQKPDDLLNICETQFNELMKLGFNEIRNTIITVFNDDKSAFLDYNFSDFTGGSIANISYNSHPIITDYLKLIKGTNDAFAEIIIEGDKLAEWKKFRIKTGQPDDPRLENIPALYYYFYSIGIAAIGISTFSSINKEKQEILKRFKNVFDFAYRRYSDVSLAEAQAREAMIEAALEKVRSRTMAMYKSDELSEVAEVLFQQITRLGYIPDRISIGIFDEQRGLADVWATDQAGCQLKVRFKAKNTERTTGQKVFNDWKAGKKISIVILEGENLKEWIEYTRKELGMAINDDYFQGRRVHNFAFFSQGWVNITTLDILPDETLNVLLRFAAVFNLTYTRFLDLQKAEAQAREARIEAALERVRTKAMSMHSSQDLSETIAAFYGELSSLSFTPRRCGVGLIDKETRITELSTMNSIDKGNSIEVIGKIKLEAHPVLDNIFDNWLLQKEYHPVLRGPEIKEYYKTILPQISFPDYSNDQVHFGYFFYFQEGAVYTWTMKELEEDELQIYRRFTSVLSLTYRRYMDLKETEQRAMEAVKQAALDRVRAEIASMRTVEDLQRITPLIWRELKTLNVPFIRCGVFIIDKEKELVQAYLTTPEGNSLGVLEFSSGINEVTANLVKHSRECKIYKVHWDQAEFANWTKSMIELGQIENSITYQGSAAPPESLDLHFIPFTQGMLYVGNTSPLDEEKIKLVKSLAEAFSIAYARYEDFKNLKEAKKRIEITLNELKSAQAQLIHSEKMASLGELTAGIAHEIKNPLNFVNNFSELAQVLLDDMKTEIANNNKEEIEELINGLKLNLEKINYHGKRADSIVKGMLLHSRSGSGDMALTNINDLLDQFVNLAFHGMRAQDKSFNITINKDYDPAIPKIKVVPQDLSRAFLNIINNACYAAHEKKKKSGDEFSPVLSVATKNMDDKVIITIRDNGDGIPESIRKNIFSPFFTTKPTGEGTGLGLSLCYDIITKVHGGEIRFESEEGKFTEFIISIPKQV